MSTELKESEQQEIVRQAVIKRGGSVTVGDIISETGLDSDSASAALRALISTHEGTMRVSESGELMYSFAPGVILRDQRSWWDRNKKTVYKGLKAIGKATIFIILMVYFIIYLLILLALLSSNKDSDSRSSGGGDLFGHAFYFFWGYNLGGGSSSRGRVRDESRQPVYTRVYNFMFGPEEPEADPLANKAKCAQLIRAKNGVITVEDWMAASGQTKEKCESDLARYTAEFGGNAEILNDGTLIYVFEDMMKSMAPGTTTPMPAPVWKNLPKKRPLSGNINGGNGMVIGLNIFNLIWASLFAYGGSALLSDPEYVASTQNLATTNNIFMWLGVVPLIFSALIFLVPLIRLPGNIRENKRRRKEAIYRSLVGAIFDNRGYLLGIRVEEGQIIHTMQVNLRRANQEDADKDEFQEAINSVLTNFGGDIDVNDKGEKVYIFDETAARMATASTERSRLALNKQQLGNVVFSTNNDEQSDIYDREHDRELDDFDRQINNGRRHSDYNPYDNYNGNNNNRIDYIGR